MASRPARPATSCIVAGVLVGVGHPAQHVIAEVLALAEDGYVEVVADDEGYTLRRGPAEPAMLWEDRAEVLAGLFHGGDEVRLRRPVLPPLVPPHGPISTDRLRTAVSRAGERYGFLCGLRWLVLAGALLGLAGAVTAAVVGSWTVAASLGMGVGLLGTAWLHAPVRLSRAAHAERDRLRELQRQLRDGPDANDPALLPWALLLLTDQERRSWWRRSRARSPTCPVG
jgi:hypothetical protein